MRKFNLFLATALGALMAGSLQAQTYTPVSIAGFNHDVFAEAGSDATLVTDTVLDATNHIMYTQAFGSANGLSYGLPDNGIIQDAVNAYNFQLAPYNGPNAVTLMRGVERTISLQTPAAYGAISLLAFSAENASNVTVTLHFSDGTSTVTPAATLTDWFFATSNVVTSGFGRIVRLTGGPYTVDGAPSDPRFYHLDINLSCTDRQKILESVIVKNTTSAGSNAPFPNTVVLALAGSASTQNAVPSSTAATCGQSNGTATISVTGNTGPYTYSWNTSPVQTGATATGLAAGAYTVVVANGGGCTSSYVVNVPSGGGTAAATATASPATICSGASSQLSVTVGTGIGSATWNPGSLSGATVSVSPAGTTAYTVSGTDGNGCAFSAAVTVNVTPSTPPPAPLASATPGCEGSSSTLSVQNPNVLYTYTWYSSASGGSPLATGLSYTTPPLPASTVYYVQADLPCASSTRTAVNVSMYAVPQTPTVTAAAICSGNTATLTVQNPQGGITYSWFAAAAGGSPLASGSSFTTGTISTPTTYYVEAANGICVLNPRIAATVTVNPIPMPPVAPGVTICAGLPAALSVQSPDAATIYSWFAASGGGGPLATGPTYTTPALNAGATYYVEAAAAGCSSATRTPVPVTVSPAPLMPAAADALICPNSSAVLSVQNPQAGATYNWYTAPNAGTLLFSGPVYNTPVLTAPATYYLEAAVGSCINGRAAVAVDLLAQLRTPVVTGSLAGSIATFSWLPVAGATGYEVSSDGGSTWTIPSSGATGTTHVITGIAGGAAVTLQVRALGSDPCVTSSPGTASIPIGVDDVFVPNVFTPNGDGRNDVLLVYASALLSADFRVWDQWGNEVFHSSDPKTGWDGRYRGQPAAVGVYAFALKAVLPDGRVVTKKGSVNLLR